MHRGAVDVKVLLPKRGQPERSILARVFIIAHPDARLIENAHDGGDDLLTVEGWASHVLVDPVADAREGGGEGQKVVVLRLVADLAPATMVAVLLAPSSVTTDRLDVTVGERRDPHVSPGGRNHDVVDALQLVRVGDAAAVSRPVDEATPAADPANARCGIAAVAQTCGAGGRVDCSWNSFHGSSDLPAVHRDQHRDALLGEHGRLRDGARHQDGIVTLSHFVWTSRGQRRQSGTH